MKKLYLALATMALAATLATGCGSSHPVDIHYVSDPASHRNFLNFVSYSLILFLLFAKLTYKHLAGVYPRSQKCAGHNYHFRYLRYPHHWPSKCAAQSYNLKNY